MPDYTYTISSTTDGLSGATIIFQDGNVVSLNSAQAHYQGVINAILANKPAEEVRALSSPVLHAGINLQRLSERVIYDAGNIFFDGDPIDDSLARHIVRIIGEGGNENQYGALVKFMEKLATNPSEKSRRSLYEFLVRQNITIAPDGDFIAYKGLKRDGSSIHAGYGVVNGTVIEHGSLMNSLGAVIEIPRSRVDDDTRRGCSTGLHAGSYAYANGFAQGMLVTVKINPRDVVSVPDDCNFQKIRTARYVVLAQTEVEDTRTTYGYTAERSIEDDDWDWDNDEEQDEDYCYGCGETLDNCYCDLDDDDTTPATRNANVALTNTDRVTVDGLRQAAAQGITPDQVVVDYLALAADNGPRHRAADASDEHEVSATGERILDVRTGNDLDFYDDVAGFLDPHADTNESPVFTFTYRKANGEVKLISDFRVTEVERNPSGVRILGKNENDEWRSYKFTGISGLLAVVRTFDA